MPSSEISQDFGERREQLLALGVGPPQPREHDALGQDVRSVDGFDGIEGQHLGIHADAQDLLVRGEGLPTQIGQAGGEGRHAGGSLQEYSTLHVTLPVFCLWFPVADRDLQEALRGFAFVLAGPPRCLSRKPRSVLK